MEIPETRIYSVSGSRSQKDGTLYGGVDSATLSRLMTIAASISPFALSGREQPARLVDFVFLLASLLVFRFYID
jgi:hypothetical protein